MTKPFSPEDFELLAIEARSQFEWARDEGDSRPEGIAFMVDQRVIGGHNRSGIDTAIVNALSYLNEAFNGVAHNPIPTRILMVTGEGESPCEAFVSDLQTAARHPVLLTVMGPQGTKARELLID